MRKHKQTEQIYGLNAKITKLNERNEALIVENETLRRSLTESDNIIDETVCHLSKTTMTSLDGKSPKELRMCLIASEEKRKDLEMKVLALLDYLKDKDTAHVRFSQIKESAIDKVDKQHKYKKEIAALQQEIRILRGEKSEAMRTFQNENQEVPCISMTGHIGRKIKKRSRKNSKIPALLSSLAQYKIDKKANSV